MPVVPLEPPRRLRGDSGTALVEAAFLTPIFMYLIFGILELGLLFRDYLTLGAATQDAARTASVLGNDSTADYKVIQAVKESTSGIPTSVVTRLVVFKATGPDSSVPATCKTASTYSTSDSCNVYFPNPDWTNPVSKYNTCVAASRAYGWCPKNRKTALTGTNGPPDYLGIYVEFNHKYLTGLFGTNKVLSDQTITRLEPQSLA